MVVFSQHPQLKSIKGKLLKLGARRAMMTGSGSALFGMFSKPRDAGSRRSSRFGKSSLRIRFTVYDGEPRPLPRAVAAAIGSFFRKQNMAAPRPVRTMRFEQLKIFTGNANPALAAKICASLGCTAGLGRGGAILGRRNSAANPGKCTRRRRFRGAAHLHAGGSPPDGIAAHDRRTEAGFCGAHHGSVTLLWVCAAGPERQAADADFRPVDCQPDSDGPARIVCLLWTCTRLRSRVFSMFPWIIFSPRR